MKNVTRKQTQSTDQFVKEQNRANKELLINFGDKIDQKEEGFIRIRFQNINGIKGMIRATHKVFTVMEEKEIDVLGFAKTNIN